VDSSSICVVMALCAFINYLLFDSTKQGMALALACAVAAPAAELLLMQTWGLWHYPAGDLATSIGGGLPKWVPFCYFLYVPWVASLSRYLWKTL
jgi:heat shock protein 5